MIRTFFKQFLYSFRVYRVYIFKKVRLSNFATYNHQGLSHFRLPKFSARDVSIPSEIDFHHILRTIENHLIRSRPIRILDFGGGDLGLFRLVSERFGRDNFQWVLVEVPNMYIRIQEEWGKTQMGFKFVPDGFQVAEFPNLIICKEIPDDTFEICIAGAVLGWVESPKDVFRRLTQVSKTLIITRTLMEKKLERLALQRTLVGDEHINLRCWLLDLRSLTVLTNMTVENSWLSSEIPIYTIFGKWHFRSLVMSHKIT